MTDTKYSLALAVSTAVLVASCGGSSSDEPPINRLVDVPEIEPLGVSLEPLGASSNTVATVIKNGVFMRSLVNQFPPAMPDPIATADAAAPESSSSAGGRFSSTITQEQNVDEADRVKYDGNYLYIASNGNYPALATASSVASKTSSLQLSMLPSYQPASIRVLQRENDDSLTEVNSLQILDEEENGYINGIYLSTDRLAAIYDQYNYSIQSMEIMPAIDIWRPFEQNFGLQIFDKQDANVMDLIAKYSIDGYVISSRRVGDQLIVASTFSPNSPEYVADQETEEGQKENYNQLLRTDIAEFLPKYTDADGNESNLVEADDCYIQSDADTESGFDSVVTLSSFNLSDGSLNDSVCVVAYMDNFYVSENSIYLYATDYSDSTTSSVIHKFAFNDTDLSYQASGTVTGEFGWNQSQMRFSERDGFLRVVSSQRGVAGLDHQFNVLQQQGSTLELVAQLPNDANPGPIGKPGEDIYAVRYFGNKAYIVTFLRRDPLYVLDLTDNTNPQVLGELDIPGYSAYLHPLGDDFVMGVGQQVSDIVTSVPEPLKDPDDNTIIVADESPIEEGAKVELYNVSDPANPQVAGTIVFENGYTPVEWDYHALTYLAMSDTEHRFALPLESWSTSVNEDGSKSWDRKVSLQLINVDLTNNGSMASVGEVIPVADAPFYYGGWDDRAIIHEDIIYYVHGDYVWQSLWTDPNISVGPY